MRAISIRQPWAWAIATGRQGWESRSWRPSVEPGERVAIHASRSDWGDEDLAECEQVYGTRPPEELDIGAIVAVATVERVEPAPEPGRWRIVWREVQPVEPTDVRGALGLWPVPDDLARAIDPGERADL